MSDDSPHGPNLLVSGLIGGLVGAAFIDNFCRHDAAQLRDKLDQIDRLERRRLTQEKQRLHLSATESQRNEAERLYRRDILWLSHCDHAERLDYLLSRHQDKLINPLAELLAGDAAAHHAPL